MTVVLAVMGGGVYYHYSLIQRSIDPDIYDFQDDRDTQDVLAIMKKDWDLLVASSNYSAEFMLKNRAPSDYEPEYFGKMRIKVLRQDNRVVGFVTYYMQKMYQGHILFLAVDKDYRGKGYAKRLINYALQDLKAMGASYARILTYLKNLPAQKLYGQTLGFTEYARDSDHGYIWYKKALE